MRRNFLVRGLFAAVCLLAAAEGRAETYDCLNPGGAPGICRRPAPSSYKAPPLSALPVYDGNSGKEWQLDLRGQDLSTLDLSGRIADLRMADFDSRTKFPAALPAGFIPAAILERGCSQGLGLGKLHAAGVTGRGVAISIIDQPLLTTHSEYAGALKSYEEINMPVKAPEAAMHGAAVASIAVGKTCGVAPGAELYYIANRFTGADGSVDFALLARAVDRVVALSEKLPAGKRIRAISISRGFRTGDKGFSELLGSINKAKKAGMLVVTTSMRRYYDYDLSGLGREPEADPDNKDSYGPGLYWRRYFLSGRSAPTDNTLLVPMDSRTTAAPDGDTDFVFYRTGGLSWGVPYLVGLYALACQAKPDVTPEAFLKAAAETGDSLKVQGSGRSLVLEKVVNPGKLLSEIKSPAAERPYGRRSGAR